jgi:hypothetical protein
LQTIYNYQKSKQKKTKTKNKQKTKKTEHSNNQTITRQKNKNKQTTTQKGSCAETDFRTNEHKKQKQKKQKTCFKSGTVETRAVAGTWTTQGMVKEICNFEPLRWWWERQGLICLERERYSPSRHLCRPSVPFLVFACQESS